MGIFDDIKNAVTEHEAEMESAIDKVADFIDEKTGGKFSEHVDQAQDFLKDNIGEQHEPEAPAVVTDEVATDAPEVIETETPEYVAAPQGPDYVESDEQV